MLFQTPLKFLSPLYMGILYYFLKKYHPHWPSFSQLINDRQILSSARSVLRDIFESDSSYIPLLEHYKYHEILNLILQHREDLIIFKPLSSEEMKEQWVDTLQTITQKSFTIDFAHLENIQEQCIRQKKELANKADALLLDKLFTTCHPQNFENLENYHLLLQKLVQNFQIQWTKFKEKKGFIQIEDLEMKLYK